MHISDFRKSATPTLKALHYFLVMASLAFIPLRASAAYEGWKHAESVYVLTTPDGADLPASASVKGFPVLVRLHKDFFDFAQAKPNGEDLRVSTPAGEALAYQIDEWDAAKGTAAVWVRVPEIKGDARQEIVLHWGNADAASESSGKAVFNKSNGYVSVWHMGGDGSDEVGTLVMKDTGTSAAEGVVGQARSFPGGKGIFGGDKITDYPSGDAPHSSEAWFRARRPNTTILGWGNEGGGRGSKVRMQLRSPPHVHIDSDFSDVNGEGMLPMGKWIHVVHTYGDGEGKVYINGKLDGAEKPKLAIKSPSRLWIGGWYDNYDFVGDIDEVRISNVARSADWVRLEFENQKPLQTLTGPVVQKGDAFSVAPDRAQMSEGRSVTFSARAGGAQKIYWILKKGGTQTVVATDRLGYTFDAGRVQGDTSATLTFKAIYADSVKTIEIPLTVKKSIPDPDVTLSAPAQWDGRSTIELTPRIANVSEMKAAGAEEVRYIWSVDDIAVIEEVSAGKLILRRALNSGPLKVTVAVDNGGAPVTRSVEIAVTEPAHDAWVARTAEKEERPEENQFYPRDEKNEGTLIYNGELKDAAERVFVRVYADGKQFFDESHEVGPDKHYTFAVKLKPGLVHYKAEFGTKTGVREAVLETAENLACGDVYLIDGQSNAEATSWGNEEYAYSSEWVRSFGSMEGSPDGARRKEWANAVARGPEGHAQIGYWGMELGRRIVEGQKIPVCILNGAVGGTRIDQHQRNPADPQDLTTIYGRLLWRTRQAKLTHGVRAILWHQGENDQGADGPTGGFGWETYRQYFFDMAAGWKQDYPNVNHYYVFQIWPKSCAMGFNGSDNRLREVQRNLPTAFSGMSIMSTLGIDPPGGCHYPPAGYGEFARLIYPLVERDNYEKVFDHSITAPNLKQARFAGEKRDAIALEFDQPVKWDKSLVGEFYLDGEAGKVKSGAVSGNTLMLQLGGASTARTITYLDSKSWSQSRLLRGENGIAALTFCEVPVVGAKGGQGFRM
ncbi:MAG TPA: DUF2341 domain-containing protein [Tepidisphaeraceae bacterium]|nr:DUF2341 domain-containing protein [Tepidisphaeraceae bacterium]